MKVDLEEEKTKGTQGLTDEVNVSFMKLDCASLKSTEKFIEEFKSKESKLHTLILNAGLFAYELGKWACVMSLIV